VSTETQAFDPYNQPEPWWKTHRGALIAASVFVLTVLLTVLSFPPFDTPAFAYTFAVPAIFWAYRRPSFKLFSRVVLGAQALAWIIILNWIHHINWFGMVLLGAVVGLWIGSWVLAAWWAMPRFIGRGVLERLTGLFGLAALWVVIEWTRTWLLGGFPWLPLSSSQWQRVSILQIAAFTGAYGVSFVLICVNIGFAAYAHRLLCEGQKGLRRRSQEFFACLFLLIVCVSIHVQEVFNHGRYKVPYGRVALIQPAIPQSLKWDPTEAPRVRALLEQSTTAASKTLPDLMVWPEATTPMAVLGDTFSRTWAEGLVKSCRTPLLLGSIAIENPETPAETWYNGAFTIDPKEGLQPTWYAKRHLVPFGEYVPLRSILGWLEKVVPVGNADFTPGREAQPLIVRLRGQPVAVGPLICYEDIFPQLARTSTLAGSEVLIVLNNMAWYGESAASMQHATHSVLRAIETRRPVLRCGNNGWSGWIDEYGNIRKVISTEDAGIFVRANTTVALERDSRWINKDSFYTEYGDWFVMTSLGLSIVAFLLLRRDFKPEPTEEQVAAEDQAA
jgi:apolipoprotein N-acyltransferase